MPLIVILRVDCDGCPASVGWCNRAVDLWAKSKADMRKEAERALSYVCAEGWVTEKDEDGLEQIYCPDCVMKAGR